MALQETILPPKEYDHKYDGKLTVEYYSPDDIYLRCPHRHQTAAGPVGPTARLHLSQFLRAGYLLDPDVDQGRSRKIRLEL
jgi:hypothetical protein